MKWNRYLAMIELKSSRIPVEKCLWTERETSEAGVHRKIQRERGRLSRKGRYTAGNVTEASA